MKFNCISLLFHFSFFFLFCFVFNPEFFFSDFWVRKNSRSIIFLNFFLSPSHPRSLSLSLSLSSLHHLNSCIQFFSLVFHFFPFFYSRLLYLFFVVVVACHLLARLLALSRLVSFVLHILFFFLLLLNRSSVIKI